MPWSSPPPPPAPPNRTRSSTVGVVKQAHIKEPTSSQDLLLKVVRCFLSFPLALITSSDDDGASKQLLTDAGAGVLHRESIEKCGGVSPRIIRGRWCGDNDEDDDKDDATATYDREWWRWWLCFLSSRGDEWDFGTRQRLWLLGLGSGSIITFCFIGLVLVIFEGHLVYITPHEID